MKDCLDANHCLGIRKHSFSTILSLSSLLIAYSFKKYKISHSISLLWIIGMVGLNSKINKISAKILSSIHRSFIWHIFTKAYYYESLSFLVINSSTFHYLSYWHIRKKKEPMVYLLFLNEKWVYLINESILNLFECKMLGIRCVTQYLYPFYLSAIL